MKSYYYGRKINTQRCREDIFFLMGFTQMWSKVLKGSRARKRNRQIILKRSWCHHFVLASVSRINQDSSNHYVFYINNFLFINCILLEFSSFKLNCNIYKYIAYMKVLFCGIRKTSPNINFLERKLVCVSYGEAYKVLWQRIHEDGHVEAWRNFQRAGTFLSITWYYSSTIISIRIRVRPNSTLKAN